MKSLRDQRGAALLTALVLMGAFGAIAAVHALNVRASLRLRGAAAERRIGYYAAEGGLNVGMTRFANIFRDGRAPQSSDFTQTLTLGQHDVDISLAPTSSCSPCPPTRIPIGETFAGLNTIPYRYTVHSESGRGTNDTAAHVAAEFDIHNIPIFQFLAFTDADLFIMPLLDMTLHGRMHTNGNLYIQPDAVLKIEDLPGVINDVQLTAVGEIYRGGRKYDASWRCWGDAFIDKLEDVVAPPGDLDPLAMGCATASPLPDSTLDDWLGSVRAGVNNIVTPSPDIFARGSGAYWENADLRIVLRLDQTTGPIDFSEADLCPNGPGAPGGPQMLSPAAIHPIEVQSASGATDASRTRALLRFMCERRGAIFYNDVPTFPPIPPDPSLAVFQTNYSPNFASPQRVYRRVGEDTSGDGVVDASDINLDVCPVGSVPPPPLGSGAAPPWHNAATCPPFTDPPAQHSWYSDMDYRRGGFFNHREQQWMYLLNVNLRALIEWNALNGDALFPHADATNGGLVVFLTVQGPLSGAANNYGVRVFDSADLDTANTTFPPGVTDPTGVSVVSDQLAIVQGNFNSVDKYPAAIMADAVHILSQGWEVPTAPVIDANVPRNDLKSTYTLASSIRDVPDADDPGGATFTGASAFRINAALLFGLGPSTLDTNWYNGGLENFARGLESWDGRTLIYRGSFVSLGEPLYKNNDWHCGSGDACNIYDPPLRNFDYDVDFDAVENLPPMTPRFVYLQQRMYTRFYE